MILKSGGLAWYGSVSRCVIDLTVESRDQSYLRAQTPAPLPLGIQNRSAFLRHF